MTHEFAESRVSALVTAVLAGIAGIAGSYAVAGYTPSFVAAPIASFLTQNVPDRLLRFAIGPVTQFGQQIGIEHLGQRLNLLLALALGTALFAGITLAALAAGRRFEESFAAVGLAGVGVWIVATALTVMSVSLTTAVGPALGAAVGSTVVVGVAALASTADETADISVSRGRREALGSVASTLGIGVLGYVLGTRGSSAVTRPAAPADANDGDDATGDPYDIDGSADGDGSTPDATSAEDTSADAGGDTPTEASGDTPADAGGDTDESGGAGSAGEGTNTAADATGGDSNAAGNTAADAATDSADGDSTAAGDATDSAGGASTGNDTGGSTPTAEDAANLETAEEFLDAAEQRSLGIDNLEGLVSGDDFYEVDIKNINPQVNAENWSLSITGAVENEMEYTYEDITSMERERRFVTLRCVSDTLNGKKMDNDLWTGVPTSRLIEEANPQGEFVMLRSVDNYYEEFEVSTLQDSFVAYGKHGGPLPRKHGYPVRAVVGGHWGEISVKWVNEIEILEEPQQGFWEKKGWHGTGPVNTVAKLHATNRLDSGEIQVAGHTFAGTRGIKRVEVSTDGGETWESATLSERLPPGTARPESAASAQNAWRQWEYTYEPPSGGHEVVVRAVDGTGELQPTDNKSSPYPNGAAGWVSKTING